MPDAVCGLCGHNNGTITTPTRCWGCGAILKPPAVRLVKAGPPDYLACCDPKWMAYRPSGAAWVHAERCPVAGGQKVLSEELEDARSQIPSPDGTPTECSWHVNEGADYTTGGVCAGPNCIAYAEAWSDRDDDLREVLV